MPKNPDGMKAAIQETIKNLMDRVMNRVLYEDPFQKTSSGKTIICSISS